MVGYSPDYAEEMDLGSKLLIWFEDFILLIQKETNFYIVTFRKVKNWILDSTMKNKIKRPGMEYIIFLLYISEV